MNHDQEHISNKYKPMNRIDPTTEGRQNEHRKQQMDKKENKK